MSHPVYISLFGETNGVTLSRLNCKPFYFVFVKVNVVFSNLAFHIRRWPYKDFPIFSSTAIAFCFYIYCYYYEVTGNLDLHVLLVS